MLVDMIGIFSIYFGILVFCLYLTKVNGLP